MEFIRERETEKYGILTWDILALVSIPCCVRPCLYLCTTEICYNKKELCDKNKNYSVQYKLSWKHGFRPIKYSLNDEFEINRNNLLFFFLLFCYLKHWFSKYAVLIFFFWMKKNVLKYILRLLNQFPGNVEFVAYHHNFVATFFRLFFCFQNKRLFWPFFVLFLRNYSCKINNA